MIECYTNVKILLEQINKTETKKKKKKKQNIVASAFAYAAHAEPKSKTLSISLACRFQCRSLPIFFIETTARTKYIDRIYDTESFHQSYSMIGIEFARFRRIRVL